MYAILHFLKYTNELNILKTATFSVNNNNSGKHKTVTTFHKFEHSCIPQMTIQIETRKPSKQALYFLLPHFWDPNKAIS